MKLTPKPRGCIQLTIEMIRPLLVWLLPILTSVVVADGPPGGETIYREMCASCHGKAGEGVPDKYEEALFGDRSVESLARLIDRTMPDGEADKLDAEGSRKVAEFIHGAFYSPAARARLNPPKRELARLTNRQFRESVADLFGSFGRMLPHGEGRGLAAKYFDSDGMNKKAKKRIEREDRAVDFDFGEGAPAEEMKKEQFSIEWEGSLLPVETGWYEFRIKTQNGVRLYLNTYLASGDGNHRDDSDAKREAATIDGWVTLGPEVREEKARVFLLGGRAYPLRLDYFKYKEKTGSVRMEWKPPHGVWEVIAAPFLSPAKASRVLVVSTAFPPDDGSMGYERGTSISQEWHEATTRAALEISAEIAGRLGRYLDAPPDAPDRPEKARKFIATLAERAFRRPLDDAQRKLYVERPFEGGVALDVAVKRGVLAILKSPRFLYPALDEMPDGFSTASRLALAMWDSLPDQPLFEAAARGELRTAEQVRAQAERMVRDPRARAKAGDFFLHWLAMQEAEDLSKDASAYPGFTPELVADLRRSITLFVDGAMWSEASDYRQIILADTLVMNEHLAKFYGLPVPEGGGFAPVKADPAQRAGIITHPFLLAMHSYHKSSSPIHRGVFLTRNVLGRTLKPPPMAIALEDSRFDPSLTMREKVTELTKKESCMGCHVTINPLGFALENFDAAGRFRTTDSGKPVNPVSDYVTSEGEKVRLTGPRDLAAHTAASEAARRGFVRQMFHHLVRQPVAAYGGDTLERLDSGFVAGGTNMRKLFTEIATTAALDAGATPKQASR